MTPARDAPSSRSAPEPCGLSHDKPVPVRAATKACLAVRVIPKITIAVHRERILRCSLDGPH
jgi:hypothetical protein